ncbi:MAG: hypothetical protein JST62_04060 [Bacteroidetes bacterium]|nr:hypothetical protein [Bacteroidota bacterium]
MKNLILSVLLFGTCLISCKNDPKHDYEYIALSKFQNDTSIISDGTPVEIFAMSGSGVPYDDENVYYYQVLVRNAINGDTLNILSPLFKLPFEDEGTGRIYFSPNEYNYNLKILNATYERKTDTLNLLLQGLNGLNKPNQSSVDLTNYFNKGMVKNEVVAKNLSMVIFNNNYKTVVGILAFRNDPR